MAVKIQKVHSTLGALLGQLAGESRGAHSVFSVWLRAGCPATEESFSTPPSLAENDARIKELEELLASTDHQRIVWAVKTRELETKLAETEARWKERVARLNLELLNPEMYGGQNARHIHNAALEEAAKEAGIWLEDPARPTDESKPFVSALAVRFLIGRIRARRRE